MPPRQDPPDLFWGILAHDERDDDVAFEEEDDGPFGADDPLDDFAVHLIDVLKAKWAFCKRSMEKLHAAHQRLSRVLTDCERIDPLLPDFRVLQDHMLHLQENIVLHERLEDDISVQLQSIVLKRLDYHAGFIDSQEFRTVSSDATIRFTCCHRRDFTLN
jgi:hypothetical protein